MGILAQPQVVDRLVDQGCLMQLTAGSLLGAFGPQVQKFSATLVAAGLVHFVSTDAHGPRSRRPLLSQAQRRVAELIGSSLADELCADNPAAVAAGGHVAAGRRAVAAARPKSWFGWKKAA